MDGKMDLLTLVTARVLALAEQVGDLLSDAEVCPGCVGTAVADAGEDLVTIVAAYATGHAVDLTPQGTQALEDLQVPLFDTDGFPTL